MSHDCVCPRRSETPERPRPARPIANCIVILALMTVALGLGGCVGLSPQPRPILPVEGGSAPAPAEWGRVISSSDNGLEFECQIDGAVNEDAAFFFLIPPEGEITVRILKADAPDGKTALPSLQTGSLNRVVTFKPGGFLRAWRIGTLSAGKRVRGASIQGVVRMRIALDYAQPYTAPEPLAAQARDVMAQPRGFGQIVRSLVENPDDAVHLAAVPPPAGPGDAPPPSPWLFTTRPEASEFWIKIPVVTAGLYAITPDTLREMGLRPENYLLTYFRLFHQGREIPLVEYAPRGTRFDGPNRLFFAGEASASAYSASSIYWLAYTPEERGRRTDPFARPPAAAPTIALETFSDRFRWEEESELLVHRGNFLSIEEIRWVGPTLSSDQPTSHVFDLPGYATEQPGDIQMELRFFINRGAIPPQRTFHLSLNGGYSTQFSLVNSTKDSVTLNIPPSALRERGNQLTLAITSDDPAVPPLQPNAVYLDFVEFAYQRRLAAEDDQLFVSIPVALTDQATTPPVSREAAPWRSLALSGFSDFPVLVMNAANPAQPQFRLAINAAALTVALPGASDVQLRAHSLASIPAAATPHRPVFENLVKYLPECDHLIISHEEFLEAIEPLAAWHRDKGGLRVAVVDVQSIYDEFNFGIESPFAIKSFLRFLGESRGLRAPAYVLLVGDCTSDYQNYARNDVVNFVPSYSYHIGTSGTEIWASDYWYSTVLGDDPLGDFILGRISVNNRADAEHIVAKTINYLENPVFEPWRTRLTYVADDGEFDDECETLRRRHTPRHYLANTVYLNNLPLVDNFYLPQDIVEEKKAKVSTDGTARIIRAFNGGTLYMSFFGHGSPNIWCDERLWFGGDSDNSDNLHLTNFDRPTFVVNMTCNSGAIDYPIPRWNICITEDMMRMKDGGAIGVFAPSGPGFSTAHQVLAGALRDGLFRRSVRGMGEATLRARLFYALRERTPDLVRMFVLLGDPAVELQVPRGRAPFTPEAIDTIDPTARRIQIAAAPGFLSGRASFFLMDDAGRIVASDVDKPFDDGQADAEFDLPERPMNAEWHISGYFVDQESRDDSTGGITIRRYRPWVTLEEFQETPTASVEAADPAPNPPDEGEPEATRSLTAVILNQTPLPVDDVRFVIESLADDGRWKELQSRTVNLAGGERHTDSIVIDEPGPGVTALRLRLLNHTEPPLPTQEARTEKALALIATHPAGEPLEPERTIVIPSSLLVCAPRSAAGDQIAWTLDGVAANLHPERSINATIRLHANGQELAQSNRLSISPGAQTAIRLFFNMRPAEWPRQFELTTDGNWQTAAPALADAALESPETDGEDSIRLRQSLTLPLPALPDIALVETVHSPLSPTEGETVFIDVRLTNAGQAPARDIVIKAFDADPAAGGTELTAMIGRKETVRVPWLIPGGETQVRLRWDPYKNLDQKQIVVVADPNLSILDSDRGNNSATLPLRVRTKAQLRGRSIYFLPPTDEERRQRRIRIEAVVENTGETEAHGIVVAMYKTRAHRPEDLIAEVMIERIDPGHTQTATAVWNLTEADLVMELKPSFLIYFKGSSQRTVGVTAIETPVP